MSDEIKQEIPGLKITEDRASETPKVNIEKIKASDRTRSHLNSPAAINRTFSSPEEMAASAEEKFGVKNKEEVEEDKKKGFDINDVQSIIKFAATIPYVPMGNSLVVKFINEEQKYGTIIIPSGNFNSSLKRAVVVVPGLYVNTLKAGDVITMLKTSITNPFPYNETREFNEVKFKEIEFGAVAGVYKTKAEIMARIIEENKAMKEAEK